VGIGIARLLLSVLILSVVMTIANTALRTISSGGSVVWIVLGGVFAVTIYALSSLVSRKSEKMFQQR